MRKVNYTKELLEEKVKDCYSFAEERNFYRSSLKFECPMRNHRSRISLIKQFTSILYTLPVGMYRESTPY